MTKYQTLSRPLVVVDPHYGSRLQHLSVNRPVRIVMSPINEPIIRAIWQTRLDRGSVKGITGFPFFASRSPEDCFLAELGSIDLHFGPHSNPASYRELEVVGSPLTLRIRNLMAQLGFAQFIEGEEGFVATRNEEEASQLRV